MSDLRRDILAGGVAGLTGGVVLGWAGFAAKIGGLLDLEQSGAGLLLHLLVSIPVGALFGVLFRYQPGGYAASISNGLLYSLLWWIAGPLTLTPIVMGNGPAWSVQEAYASFPTLIGHLLYGGLTGLGFYVLVTLYIRARPEPEGVRAEPPVTRVVILGGGFGGISTARQLEQISWRDSAIEITLVSQSNYLLFTPMLAEVAAGALEPQHISSPVRASLPRTSFHRAEVEEIDTSERLVRVRAGSSSSTETLRYDHLVLALGSVPHYFGMPGMEGNCFTLKTQQDASDLRNHVITQLERADVNSHESERRRQLTFVVAGGGFAGTELVAELFDLVHSVLHYYPNIRADELRFVLIHSRDRILPELGEKLADYALRKLQARGIEFMLNTRVGGANARGVLIGDSEELLAGTLVWTAGNQPNPILKTLPCERNRAGAVVAEATLKVKGLENVWAVGDCAQIPIPDEEGQFCPPTAQHAIRQGKMAARNIAASLKGKPPKEFHFHAIGLLVPLGHRTGAAEIRGLRFSGPIAWLMWRAIYLTLLPGLEKKVRVSLDWLIDLFFPRDIVLTSDFEAGAAGRGQEVDGREGSPQTEAQPEAPRERTR